MQVSAVQFDIAWQDKPANRERVGAMVATARPQEGTLIVLPEMFATGFSMDAGSIAEPPGGPTEGFLAGLARTHRLYVVGGVAATTPEGTRANQAVAFGPGGDLLGRYAKRRSFTLAGEDRHYTAGERAVVWSVGPLRVAPAVCYDLRFPELLREATAAGAECLVVIANWPAVRAAHWRALLVARAIENQAFVVGVNRVGRDPNADYAGGSLIVDPTGEVLVEAASDPTVLHANLDPQLLRDWRRQFPAIDDLRSAGAGSG